MHNADCFLMVHTLQKKRVPSKGTTGDDKATQPKVDWCHHFTILSFIASGVLSCEWPPDSAKINSGPIIWKRNWPPMLALSMLSFGQKPKAHHAPSAKMFSNYNRGVQRDLLPLPPDPHSKEQLLMWKDQLHFCPPLVMAFRHYRPPGVGAGGLSPIGKSSEGFIQGAL